MTGKEQDEVLERFPKLREQLADLQEALEGAGVTFPGLRLDPASYLDGIDGIPIFDFGLCNMMNAKRLIEVLRKGAS